jgi:hypothetical protein
MLKSGRKIVTILEIVKIMRRKIKLRRRYQSFLEFVQTAEATSNHGKIQRSIVENCEYHTWQEQDRTAAPPTKTNNAKNEGQTNIYNKIKGTAKRAAPEKPKDFQQRILPSSENQVERDGCDIKREQSENYGCIHGAVLHC